MEKIHLVRREMIVGNKPFYYCAPIDDNTVVGTCAALKENDFGLHKVYKDENDIVVDLGCNVGLISCLLAQMSSSIRVFAFDPNPIACMCARLNSGMNNITNLEIFNIAIGDEYKKDVKFSTTKLEVSASVEEKYGSQDGKVYYSNMIPFDEIFNNKLLGIDRIKYPKIDIEGGEFAVINYICDKHPELIEKIDSMHLEIHGYPWRDELIKKVKNCFGSRWINKK